MAENESNFYEFGRFRLERANACFYAIAVGSADAEVFDILLALSSKAATLSKG